MDLPFWGHSLNAVDAKGRVSVPADFRELIANRCRSCAPGDTSIKDNELSLEIHPESDRLRAYDAIGTRFLAKELRASVVDIAPADRREALAAKASSTLGGLSSATFDGPGRLVIPPMLREFAEIGDHAFFLGVGDFFEIWDLRKALAAFADHPVSRFLNYFVKQRKLVL